MNLAVDKPILNNPFEEPNAYWLYEQGQPVVMNGRRPAGYYFKTRAGATKQLELLVDEQFVELELINTIRRRVGEWRKAGYPDVTAVTGRLLEHWNAPERERKLFFCQREAAETIIWLTEIHAKQPRGLDIPLDRPIDAVSISKGYRPLRRYGCKMATGSGKTVVMAMIAAWAIINKAQYPQERRFSNAILLVCPNLTVKERLQVLLPSHPQNYYEEFELVPRSLLDQLGKGKFLITNWHAFATSSGKQEGGKTYAVVNKGEESDVAFTNRVLKDLGSSGNMLVLSDEAHHAYRPALYDDEALKNLPVEERNAIKADKEAATIWVSGLDRINAARRINFCVDLSATPFYIQGSGYEPGSPFPWLASDFGLVDAIESGIVKIPRVPVDDNTGQPIPKYFHLCSEASPTPRAFGSLRSPTCLRATHRQATSSYGKAINDELPASERGTARRKPKPESVLREAEPALQQLAGEWKKTFEEFAQNNYPVPPCLIAVCDNTNIAELLFNHIAKEGRVFPELLQNSKEFEPALRIDSKLLAKAEGIDEGTTRQDIAEALRKKVSTVGKLGEPGEQVRCIVSVGMLTEGWDCLDEQTEILTPSGWVGRGQIAPGALVYSFNQDTNKLEAVPVLEYGERTVRPNERMVCIKSQRLNIRVTEGHQFHLKYRDPRAGGALSRTMITKTGVELAERSSLRSKSPYPLWKRGN